MSNFRQNKPGAAEEALSTCETGTALVDTQNHSTSSRRLLYAVHANHQGHNTLRCVTPCLKPTRLHVQKPGHACSHIVTSPSRKLRSKPWVLLTDTHGHTQPHRHNGRITKIIKINHLRYDHLRSKHVTVFKRVALTQKTPV